MSSDPSLAATLVRAYEALVEDCPGEGRCHGCLQWCDQCGDVGEVCDGPFVQCHQHGCVRCRKLLSHDEHEYAYETGGYPSRCFSCEIAVAMERAIRENNDELEAADDCRRDIERAICTTLESLANRAAS